MILLYGLERECKYPLCHCEEGSDEAIRSPFVSSINHRISPDELCVYRSSGP